MVLLGRLGAVLVSVWGNVLQVNRAGRVKIPSVFRYYGISDNVGDFGVIETRRVVCYKSDHSSTKR